MNSVVVTGRLTRDPEIRYLDNGKAVASFSVAVDSGYGENKKADFIPVVAWEKLAEVVGNNLTKGRKVLVEGRLSIREYEKDGQKRRVAEVVAKNVEFLDTKQGTQPPPAAAKSGQTDMSSFGYEVFPEEEVSF